MNDCSLFSREGKELIATVEEILFADARWRSEDAGALISSSDCVGTPVDSTISDRPKSGLTCALCQLTFGSVDEQKEHFRSDWHRHNIRRNVSGKPVLLEEEFDALSDSGYWQKVFHFLM